MALGAGTRFGPYEVLGSLGAGGMGEVYRARDTSLGRSAGGATRPLWSRDGQELFYVLLAGAVLRVGVERGVAWAATDASTVARRDT